MIYGSPSVQHISSTQKDHSFSGPKIPQFHTKNPSVLHQKPLSSTLKTRQFHTPLSSTPKPLTSAPKTFRFNTPLSSTLKTTQFNTLLRQKIAAGCVELRGSVELRGRWNWGVFCVEMKDFRCWKVWFLCGTEGVSMELRGTHDIPYFKFEPNFWLGRKQLSRFGRELGCVGYLLALLNYGCLLYRSNLEFSSLCFVCASTK